MGIWRVRLASIIFVKGTVTVRTGSDFEIGGAGGVAEGELFRALIVDDYCGTVASVEKASV